jgi:phosphoglucomutase
VGGILLTASHNPGGEHEDFGIKFNAKNGGPALETLTDRIFLESKTIKSYKILEREEEINSGILAVHDLGIVEGFDHNYKVTVIDPTENYVELMKTLFDFD